MKESLTFQHVTNDFNETLGLGIRLPRIPLFRYPLPDRDAATPDFLATSAMSIVREPVDLKLTSASMMGRRQREVKVDDTGGWIVPRGRRPEASAATGATPVTPVSSRQRSTVLFQRVFHSGRSALTLSQSSVITVFM